MLIHRHTLPWLLLSRRLLAIGPEVDGPWPQLPLYLPSLLVPRAPFHHPPLCIPDRLVDHLLDDLQ